LSNPTLKFAHDGGVDANHVVAYDVDAFVTMKPTPTLEARLRQCGIALDDLEESFARSSGPGGQNVNKVSTQVTIRHVPTGVSVTASDSRSQFTNRQLALERLLGAFQKQREEKRRHDLAEISKARRQKANRSRATKRKLVEGKRRRGETKRMRSSVRDGH
jgi:protein subunit release factor B